MKVKEIMERTGITQTGRAVAYIKDALDEINNISETHVRTQRININEDQRFYSIPNQCIKIVNIRCKHYNNEDEKYRDIPRSMYEPEIVDDNGN